MTPLCLLRTVMMEPSLFHQPRYTSRPSQLWPGPRSRRERHVGPRSRPERHSSRPGTRVTTQHSTDPLHRSVNHDAFDVSPASTTKGRSEITSADAVNFLDGRPWALRVGALQVPSFGRSVCGRVCETGSLRLLQTTCFGIVWINRSVNVHHVT